MNRTPAAIALVVANLVAVGGRAQAQDSSHTARTVARPVRAELLAAREAIWRAWFNNNRAQLDALLPQDVIAINNGDTTWQDRAAILASAEEFAHGGGKLIRIAFPRTEFQVYGNAAILYSIFELEQDGKRTVQRGRATEIFARRGGRWQNAGWHLDSGT
jgi:hypothetical protein